MQLKKIIIQLKRHKQYNKEIKFIPRHTLLDKCAVSSGKKVLETGSEKHPVKTFLLLKQ